MVTTFPPPLAAGRHLDAVRDEVVDLVVRHRELVLQSRQEPLFHEVDVLELVVKSLCYGCVRYTTGVVPELDCYNHTEGKLLACNSTNIMHKK